MQKSHARTANKKTGGGDNDYNKGGRFVIAMSLADVNSNRGILSTTPSLEK